MEETKLNEEDTVENNFETDLELEKSLRHMKFASKAIAILIVVIFFVAWTDASSKNKMLSQSEIRLSEAINSSILNRKYNDDRLKDIVQNSKLLSNDKVTFEINEEELIELIRYIYSYEDYGIEAREKDRFIKYSDKLREFYPGGGIEMALYQYALEYFKDPEIAHAVMPFIEAKLLPDIAQRFSSEWMKQLDIVKDCSNKMYYVDYHEKAHPDSSILDKYRYLLESCAMKMDVNTDELYSLIYATHILAEDQYLSGGRENPPTMYQILEFIDTSLPDDFVASEKMVQDLCVIYTTNLTW